jgi:hypothetical protein
MVFSFISRFLVSLIIGGGLAHSGRRDSKAIIQNDLQNDIGDQPHSHAAISDHFQPKQFPTMADIELSIQYAVYLSLSSRVAWEPPGGSRTWGKATQG